VLFLCPELPDDRGKIEIISFIIERTHIQKT